jgi:transcriptional regulator MraZ
MEAPETVQPIFAGEFRHAMDAKNRVTIPSRWRRGEVDEFFAIPDLDGGFLMLMPPEVIRQVAEKVEQDARLTPPERRKFIRQFYSRAQHLMSDKQGRIVVPEEHCNQLKLRGEVVLVGNHTRFEVWNPDRWKKAFEEDSPAFKHILGVVGI